MSEFTQEKPLLHISVMLQETLSFVPELKEGLLLDVTAGGGGHFFEILNARAQWRGICWDRDPEAKARIDARGQGFAGRYEFCQKAFSSAPEKVGAQFSYILADLGISSFQLDDPTRGLSFFSQAPLDFRMNPQVGDDFRTWFSKKSVQQIEEILIKFGEELRAKKIAEQMKKLEIESLATARDFAEALMSAMHMRIKKNESHPLTRVFQALRIAVNDELLELAQLLEWAPPCLLPGGRLAVISFHSLEDRKVKRSFEMWEQKGYKILTPKALTPTPSEIDANTRSRSAKLRVLERVE